MDIKIIIFTFLKFQAVHIAVQLLEVAHKMYAVNETKRRNLFRLNLTLLAISQKS